MDRLPREILAEVLEFLAGPAPSERRLHEQPSDDLLESDVVDVKSASCINKLWRALALPILFRNVLWRPRLSSLSPPDGLHPAPLLRFLLDRGLQRQVLTFTLLVDFADQMIEPSRVAYQIHPSDLETLWDQLFAVVDPLRFTIIAPPATLAALLSRMLFLDDAWSFNIPYHILSLARSHRDPPSDGEDANSYVLSSSFGSSSHHPPPETAAAGASRPHYFKGAMPAPPCPFLTLRPWTSLLLNEGSSIRAYSTYEFFLRSPPSMLSALLGTGEYPNNTPLLPATVVDFNYIAIFPLSTHVSVLLHSLPKVDRFFVRFTPRPNNRILEDRRALQHVDMADLWMERTSAFRHLLDKIFRPEVTIGAGGPGISSNWDTLNVLEIGEAEDKEVWGLADAYMSENTGWRAECEGVLVRVDEEGNPKVPSNVAVPHHLPARDDPLNGVFAISPNYYFQPVW